ncbi:MAG TPA: hypothetical protein IAD11_01870 [Candidatus Stercorousia faecigallinarum]|nr:hypothetical protein [Candidatus Stercorousia faecigallinarum]
MAGNYFSQTGLVTQSLEEIITEITGKYQGIYGNDINIDQNTPDGQMINLLAQMKKDILDLLVQYNSNIDVDQVQGIAQQILYKLNGLEIKSYTYSYVNVKITTSGPTNLQGLDNNIDNSDGTGYTIQDTNGNRWILANSVINLNGTDEFPFRAAELGGIQCLPNTVTLPETIVSGVVSVTNPAANYITGDTGESDAEYRQRRNKTVALPSQGFDESIEAQLLNLDTVTQVKVYDNRKSVEVNGIPAHTIWVIVEGGQNSEIGNIIYANIPPGIPMKGSIEVLVSKSNGELTPVYFDRGTAQTLYVKVTIKNLETTALDETDIKNKMSENLTYNIGENADTATITCVLRDILNNTGIPYDVEVSTDNSNWQEIVTPTGLDNYFALAAENITLTVE